MLVSTTVIPGATLTLGVLTQGLGVAQEATELLDVDTGVGGNRGWPVGCGGVHVGAMNLKDSGRGSQLPQLSFVVLTQSLRGRQPPHADTKDKNSVEFTNPMVPTDDEI